MWIFYVIIYYLIIWLFTFIGVKLDNTYKNRQWSSNAFLKKTITSDLKDGHLWWLVFPPVNIFAALIYFIRGVCGWIATARLQTIIVNFLFGKNEN